MNKQILESVLLIQSLVIQCRFFGLCSPRFDFYQHPGSSSFFFVVRDQGNVIFQLEDFCFLSGRTESDYLLTLRQCIDYLETQLRDYHASGDHHNGDVFMGLSVEGCTPPPVPMAVDNLDLFATPFLSHQAS